ncbi:hypothetical protein Dimus_013947, partial [Dionaea muscipula]
LHHDPSTRPGTSAPHPNVLPPGDAFSSTTNISPSSDLPSSLSPSSTRSALTSTFALASTFALTLACYGICLIVSVVGRCYI